METAIWFLGISVIILFVAVFILWRKNTRLEDEVTNMRYIRVKENEDGSYTLTSQGGSPIFEL